MRKALLALPAAAAVVTAGFAPALASAAPAAPVHHARCTETVAAGQLACNMSFGMGRHPGDVRVVIRTSREQRVDAIWALGCGRRAYVSRGMRVATPVRRHLLGRAEAAGRCRMNASVFPRRAGVVTVVFSWVNR